MNIIPVMLALLITCVCCSEPEQRDITITSVDPGAAGIGEEVKIKGSGYGVDLAVVKVFFNNKPALVKSVVDTMIVTEVPPAATSGEILINVRDRSAKWSGIFTVVNGIWTRKADFPGDPREWAIAFAIGGKGYVTGGTAMNINFRDLYEYDPVADRWSKKADFPGKPIHRGSVFTIDNKAYIGLGTFTNELDSVAQASFYEYDPAADNWTQKASFPGGLSDFGVGFSINGKGYAGLGLGIRKTAEFCEYDPQTDTWKILAKPEFPTWSGTGFVIGNIFYFGFQNSTPKDFWKYDPVTDEWTALKDLPFSPPLFQLGFAIGDKGYISSGGIMVSEYDPATDSWIQKSSAKGGLITHASAPFVIGNKAYLVGGRTSAWTHTNVCFEFDPE